MSHDYQPSWDYSVIELSESVGLSPADRTAIEAVIEDVKSGLAPVMGFLEIEVFFAEHLTLTESGDAAVAVYCNGTASRPVVGFDLAAMGQTCDEEGLSLVHQFKISIAHELGHAYQESLGLDDEHEEGFDEDDAEEFGRDWADTGEINLWLLDPELQRPGARGHRP